MRLDLGGGNFPKEGFTSIDKRKFTFNTIVADLEKGLSFIENDSIEEINADNCLEHIENFIQLMNECYRVMKVNGIFTIIVPLFPTIGAIKDPTHKRFFILESFDYFDKDWDYKKQPNYGIKKWLIISKQIKGENAYKYLTVKLKKC